jgi:hypothetical protein
MRPPSERATWTDPALAVGAVAVAAALGVGYGLWAAGYCSGVLAICIGLQVFIDALVIWILFR